MPSYTGHSVICSSCETNVYVQISNLNERLSSNPNSVPSAHDSEYGWANDKVYMTSGVARIWCEVTPLPTAWG